MHTAEDVHKMVIENRLDIIKSNIKLVSECIDMYYPELDYNSAWNVHMLRMMAEYLKGALDATSQALEEVA